MNLKIPQKAPEFIIFLWKIIDLPKISRKDLLYEISFKLFLASPSNAEKLIENSLKRGLLIKNSDSTISLSENLSKRLNSWQQSRKNQIKKRIKIDQQQRSDLKQFKRTTSSDFNTLLKAFLDKGTLHRAVSVSDSAFNILSLDLDEGMIKAEVSGSKEEPYIIEMSLDNKYLKHNCHDFIERRANNKKFCKHLAKFFLLLKEKNEELTLNLLNKIARSINEWNFSA